MKKNTTIRKDNPEQTVAVVGLGLTVPGADTLHDFWNNILASRRFFQKATLEDWGADPELFYQPDTLALDKVYNIFGAFNRNRCLDDEFKISSALKDKLKDADASLIYWLKAGHRAAKAVNWAGISPETVGVISGHVILPSQAMAQTAVALYGRESTRTWPVRPDFGRPPAGAFRLLGYSAKILAESLGFAGPAYTLDAACASSLYAVQLALDELLSGRLNAVITGGVAKADALFTQMGFCQLRALSAVGAINAFDQSADGLVVGEGAVALVLKRLDVALAHNDNVLAIIRAVGLSNDQTGNILAPQAEGQLRAMRAAWRMARTSPKALGLVEAHGTGTPLGDLVEIQALKTFMAEKKVESVPVLGSIKSNIGHLLSAAGAASLAKVILALQHKILPPSAGFNQEAENLKLAELPALRILKEPEPWLEPEDGAPRLAVVNAFGFGGVNAQAIVEEWRPEDWNNDMPHRMPDSVWMHGLPDEQPRSNLRILASQALLAPWPDYASLSQHWMETEGPPIISHRRFGSLKAQGLFFDRFIFDGAPFRLAPKDLAHILPQQAMSLRVTKDAIDDAGFKVDPSNPFLVAPNGEGVDKTRVGVFMGVDIDPRSADYAFRWIAPIIAADSLGAEGVLTPEDREAFINNVRANHCDSPLNASRVIGALGSLVASRVARYVGAGGSSFTINEGNVSGIRALRLASQAIERGDLDLAFVGVIDAMGDPKTAALDPGRLWEEGAAMLVVASTEMAERLGRPDSLSLRLEKKIEGRVGPLGGLLAVVKSAFHLKHRLISRGLGAGLNYWLKRPGDSFRFHDGPGYTVMETGDSEVKAPAYAYDEETWFLVRANSKEQIKELLQELENDAQEALKNVLLEGLGPLRSEKMALKMLADKFWAKVSALPGARPMLAFLCKNLNELISHCQKIPNFSAEEVRAQVRDLRARILEAKDSDRLVGKLALVFSGASGHYHGLGRRLAMYFPHLMATLETEENHNLFNEFQPHLFWAQQPPEEVVPVSSMLANVAFGLLGGRIIREFGIKAQAVLGYSLGEVTSLLSTGVWTDRKKIYNDLDKTELFTKDLSGELRAPRKLWNWPPGEDLNWLTYSIPRSAEQVEKAILGLGSAYQGRVFLLIINSPAEVVVGGEDRAVKALVRHMGAPFFSLSGILAVHNPTVKVVEKAYRNFNTRPALPLEGLAFYSNVTGRQYEVESEAIADSIVQQSIYGQNFAKLVSQAYDDGVRFFLEVGPGNFVARMIKKNLKDKPHQAVALSPSSYEEGWAGLSRMMVELWLAGYPVKIAELYPDAHNPAPVLPIDISIKPQIERWPEPEAVLMEKTVPVKKMPSQHVLAPVLPEPIAERRKSGPPPFTLGPLAEVTSTVVDALPVSGKDLPTDKVSALVSETLAATSVLEAINNAEAEKKKMEKMAAMVAEQPEDKMQDDFDADKLPIPREKCLEFAVGQIKNVFGPKFSEIDTLPSRVRLPNEPLMLVDRVLELDGIPLSMKPGRIVTEHDVLHKKWYLDNGHIPTGLAIESGQADLMLAAFLGVDFATRGISYYRLLDAEVTFHRKLPNVGESARYDIRLVRFFKHAHTHLFRFEFNGTVNGKPLLSMKGGCAGFFTPEELKMGRGLPGGGLLGDPAPSSINPLALSFNQTLVPSLDEKALEALRQGDLTTVFGPNMALNLKDPLTVPGGQLALIDKVVKIDRQGGRYAAGFIKTEAKINPHAWFLTSHFVGDEVMPGTLMYEGCLSSLRLYLISLGWLGDAAEVDWQPMLGVSASLKCRGQVTAETSAVSYEVHVRSLDFASQPDSSEAEPVAIADAIMLADGKPIVEVLGMNLRLARSSLAKLQKLWGWARKSPAIEEKASVPKKVALKKSLTVLGPQSVPAAPILGVGQRFNKDKLMALAVGQPSKALGEAYSRFDREAFVARLPGPPYDFMDEAEVSNCPLYKVTVGAEVVARYTLLPTSWLLREAGGARPCLPYAALNELALQPCGFLAAYMGSALAARSPMHFRNLGGEARVMGQVYGGQVVETKARLIKSTTTEDIIIQHYEFRCISAGHTIYEGATHFGFFSPKSLLRQTGLTVSLEERIDKIISKSLGRYPKGHLWPEGKWRMIDEVAVDVNGGPYALGQAFGLVAVDPGAWFFKAHFFHDPVWPGSLGLESFLQVAKAMAKGIFNPAPRDTTWSWEAPVISQDTHQWIYRGQVVPFNKEVRVNLVVTKRDEERKILTVDGYLLVDDKVIYKMTNFSLALKKAKDKTVGLVLVMTAEELKNLRQAKGFTQKQLAEALGVTASYISILEKGDRAISRAMQKKLAEVLK